MIYLGTGFCPSGWNTGHGSWDFNPKVFPEPKTEIDALRSLHFRVVPHIVIRARSIRGSVKDPFDPAVVDESSAASYWNAHRKVEPFFDGWWPLTGFLHSAAGFGSRAQNRGGSSDRPARRYNEANLLRTAQWLCGPGKKVGRRLVGPPECPHLRFSA